MSQRHVSPPSIELWAGPECTINRVGGIYFDQFERSGHAARLHDLDRFAALGVRALRYPVQWERTAPDGPGSARWAWADERLGHLRALGVRPIVGLVHHGSGPCSTSLVEPTFATGLAAFARAVAERYPWVTDYTPVNEPLTTARFSGLYGHWYPHGRDDRTFVRALVEQCRGVVLAMTAIREVAPTARLVQTDDLSKTCSTPLLAYQAAFENERRWLSWDLLCGRVGREHLLRAYLLGAGVSEAELAWFEQHACPPDVIGINHYLSGERFLDERLERYPASEHGGNGRHAYADVLAARVCAEGPAGPRVLLQEAWDRYHISLAVTEAHNGCTREEQLRWLDEVWKAAHAVRAGGADVRAVTVWSLLGAYDWDTLVTGDAGRYESGVFDLRAPTPRPTALAHMTQALAQHGHYDHPVLATPGWWRRLERLWYPAATGRQRPVGDGPSRRAARPILITGATGTLGRAFARECEARGLAYCLLGRTDLDIADPASAQEALDQLQPWALVNTAGYVRVDDAEREPDRCFRENTEGVATLAAACAGRGVKLATFSSDLVFDGAKRVPYVESDAVRPLNVYGRSKAAAEARALALCPTALVVRTSAFFGPWDEHNFVTLALRVLAGGGVFVAAEDCQVSPTYVPDLVAACLDLLIDDESGVWHLANAGAVSWADLARQAAQVADIGTGRVEGRPLAALGLAAPRPAYSVLSSARAWLMPPLDDALRRYCEASAGRWQHRDVA